MTPKPKLRELVLPDASYKPPKAEMPETVGCNGTLEQFAKALFRPVAIHRVENWKRRS